MATASKITTGLFAVLAILSFSGCAAMCKNFGCSSCGPISVGGGCGGCDECSGCGELYVDPWINHPADCCDPCDTCGNYNGQSCGSCRPMFAGIGSLWGYRNDACGGCDECVVSGGCDSCGLGDCFGCGEPACGFEPACGCEPGCGCENCIGGVVSEGDVHVVGEPTYRDEVVETMPEPYRPHRTKKIFQPRARVAHGHSDAIGY